MSLESLESLDELLTTAAAKPYRPGTHDCVTLIAQWADLLTGSNHLQNLSGTYATKFQGLGRHTTGSVCAAIRVHLLNHGWQETPIASLKQGDIVLTDVDHPGIFHSGTIHAQPFGCTGALQLHPNHAKSALTWPA